MSAPRRRNRPGSPRSGGRSTPPAERVAFAEWLLAQIGRLDQSPATMAAMQRGLNDAWAALDRAAPASRDQRGLNDAWAALDRAAPASRDQEG